MILQYRCSIPTIFHLVQVTWSIQLKLLIQFQKSKNQLTKSSIILSLVKSLQLPIKELGVLIKLLPSKNSINCLIFMLELKDHELTDLKIYLDWIQYWIQQHMKLPNLLILLKILFSVQFLFQHPLHRLDYCPIYWQIVIYLCNVIQQHMQNIRLNNCLIIHNVLILLIKIVNYKQQYT